ncbi:hypothetical protein AX769_11300 [Frondihabitans sp. PAMC 28766]|nr:hypothetical protein AX769_11300 [Frondihabitans sp. PAMC 28766]
MRTEIEVLPFAANGALSEFESRQCFDQRFVLRDSRIIGDNRATATREEKHDGTNHAERGADAD